MQVLTDDQARQLIAFNVQRLRGERSRGWLARAAGTYTINITRIEEAETLPSAGLLSRLAEALGVGTDDLLGQSEKKVQKTG